MGARRNHLGVMPALALRDDFKALLVDDRPTFVGIVASEKTVVATRCKRGSKIRTNPLSVLE